MKKTKTKKQAKPEPIGRMTITPTEQDRRIAEEAARKMLKAQHDIRGGYAVGYSMSDIILAAIAEAKKPLEEDRARLDWVICNLNKRGFGDSVNGICSREDIDAARAQEGKNRD